MEKKSFTNVSFDELPLEPSDPKHSAWGLWGKNDQPGRTNLITAEITRQAAVSQMQIGEGIPLKWVPNWQNLEDEAHMETAYHCISRCVL